MKKNSKFHKMTCVMYEDGVNINLTAGTKLNLLKEFKDQIKPNKIKKPK